MPVGIGAVLVHHRQELLVGWIVDPWLHAHLDVRCKAGLANAGRARDHYMTLLFHYLLPHFPVTNPRQFRSTTQPAVSLTGSTHAHRTAAAFGRARVMEQTTATPGSSPCDKDQVGDLEERMRNTLRTLRLCSL